MPNYILYQAYGSMEHINQCRFSLLKYLSVYNLKPPADTSLVIYTDQPVLFEAFDTFFPLFEMKAITKKEIEQWRGPNGFTHRMKINILRDFFAQHKGSLLYFDTDTYAITPLDALFENIAAGNFVMHRQEDIAEKSAAQNKWHASLHHQSFSYNNKQFSSPQDIKLWNTGVIGMNDSKKDLLEDILALTDILYQQFKKHTAEQFAFSYCFQKEGNIVTAAENIVHYYNLKEFNFLLKEFFKKNEEESIPNLVKIVHHIDPVAMQQEKEQYQKLPVYKKWLLTLTGKNWAVKQYLRKI